MKMTLCFLREQKYLYILCLGEDKECYKSQPQCLGSALFIGYANLPVVLSNIRDNIIYFSFRV